MLLCPLNATAYGQKVSDKAAAYWCRRQFRKGSERCASCELGYKFGVVKRSTPKPLHQPEQGRLW